jgi:tubulin-folding cofactor B
MNSSSNELVSLRVTSSTTSFSSERRFPIGSVITELKGKLELLTGAMASSMTLELYDKEDKLIGKLNDDERTLQSYGITDGMRIHVFDPSQKAGEFEDVSKVEKYEMSDDAYAKRGDTVRAFKQKMKLGRFAEKSNAEITQKEAEEQAEKERADKIAVGMRCEVRLMGCGARRATVAYVGETQFKPGFWIGVKYDEPVGKNDGSVGGKRYFECEPKYGGFVKPKFVVVGDFPEEDITVSDDEI